MQQRGGWARHRAVEQRYHGNLDADDRQAHEPRRRHEAAFRREGEGRKVERQQHRDGLEHDVIAP